MAIKSISLNSTGGRLLNTLAVLTCILAAGIALSWCFGNMIGSRADTKELAETAINLAPADPQGYYKLGAAYEKTFLLEDLPKSLQEYEKAVSLSPNDYRLWQTLGKSRSQNGDIKGAEKALRRAAELAPNYAQVRWLLGNNLLRQGVDEEAFVEIRHAVAQDKNLAPQAVNIAWQVFDGDIDRISQKIGDSAPIKASLVTFLASQDRIDEAFNIWNTIPDEEKISEYKPNGESILAKLLEKKDYGKYFELYNQLNRSKGENFAVGKIFNGDFEQQVKTSDISIFDWQIAPGQQPQIGLDESQKHGGSKSLVAVYNSQTGQEFRQISQTVIVEPGKTYKFEAFYRADLKTTQAFQWEIANAADGKVLTNTSPTNAVADWSSLTTLFTVPQGIQAVTVRLSRIPCKQGLCPISGRIWFDDISLQ